MKPDRRVVDALTGKTQGRRSVDPRPAAKRVDQRRGAGRSEHPQLKIRMNGADNGLSPPNVGGDRPEVKFGHSKLNQTFSSS